MFIRAWYDENTYAQFKTDGVRVMSKPLSTRTIRGTAVSRHMQNKSFSEYARYCNMLVHSWMMV